MIVAAGLSDIGCRRSANEDRILMELNELVFAVSDGMGGQRCGGRAAELATCAMHEFFLSPATQLERRRLTDQNGVLTSNDRMATAFLFANERILREAERTAECTGMGCTISALSISDNVATIGSVGDSRVYLYRAGQLVQLTRDDTVVAKLLESEKITSKDIATHPSRNLLTQSVGTRENIDIQIAELTLLSGDRLLLSSDGLHAIIGDPAISEILLSGQDPEATVRQLILRARNRGGPDNISCIVIDYR